MDNDTEYGLAASVWTKDINKAHKVAKGLRAATVWVNCHNIFFAAAPFGGYKKEWLWQRNGHPRPRKLYASQKCHYSTPSLRVMPAANQLLDQKSLNFWFKISIWR